MITIFAEKAQLLSKQPAQLVGLTHSFLKEAAVHHHPHNKLVPSEYIKQLMTIFESYLLTSTNIDAAYQLLASNSLSVLLRANFNQLAQNKLYGALVLQYTFILQHLSTQIRRQDLPQIFSYFKFAARGAILSKIINKLLERTHSFLPQFYRFVRTIVEAIDRLIKSQNLIEAEEEQVEKFGLDQAVLRMCFSKKVSLKNLVLLLKYLGKELNQMSAICAPVSQLEIVALIKDKYQEIARTLPPHYQHLLQEVEAEAKENKDQNIYLEETLAVKELTPRIYDEQQAFIVNKLRRSKLKLKKKIENDLRKDVLLRQQEAQILQDVRRQKIERQHKKELYVIQKQTAEARKFHKSMEKIKKIRKDGKGKEGGKSRLGDKAPGKRSDKAKSGRMNKHKLGFKK